MSDAILITGSQGFIGSELAACATRTGQPVIGVDVSQQNAFVAPGYRYIHGSFLQDPFPSRIFDGVDCVVHAASTTKPGPALTDYISDIEQNVVGTLRLYQRAMDAGVRRFVFLSSGGTVYGPGHGPDPICESAVCNPISYYGLSKLTAESYLRKASEASPESLAIARISNPFGRAQLAGTGQGLIATVIAKLKANESITVWGDGSAVRDYVEVADLVDCLVSLCAYRGPNQVFNIGSGVGRNVLEIIEAASIALGKPAHIVHQPARGVDVPFNVLDVSRAASELGFSPATDLVAALGREYAS
jgi:UDP-glucose 4-epimerase